MEKETMIDKKSMFIVLVLFSLLLVLPTVSAQTGCCINPDKGSDFVCTQKTQADCGGVANTNYFDGQSCSAISQCTNVCLICVATGQKGVTGTPTNPVFGPQALGCPSGQELDHIENSLTTQPTCDAYTGGVITDLPDISGKVKDAAGVGVAGATVTCSSKSATSTTDGSYSLVDCQDIGSTTITATKGGITGTRIVNIPSGSGVSLVGQDITLSSVPISTVTVQVKDSVGVALRANATVTATGYTQKQEQTASQVIFTNVPQGSVVVTADKSGYTQDQPVSFTLSSAPQTVVVTLIPVTTIKVSGSIHDGANAGQNIAGATIQITAIGYSKTATSDSTGNYQIDAPKDKQFTMAVSPPAAKSDYLLTTETIPARTTDLLKDFTLNKQSVVPTSTGMIISVQNKNTGAAVQGACVRVGGAPLCAYSDNNGQVTVTLENSQQYAITVNHADYARYDGSLTGGQGTYLALLDPLPVVTITGTVINDSSKKPINGAVISFNKVTTTTSASGTFSLISKIDPTNPIPPVFFSAASFADDFRDLPSTSGSVPLGTIALKPKVCASESITLSKPIQDGASVDLSWSTTCTPDEVKITRDNQIRKIITDPTTITYNDKPIDGSTAANPVRYCYKVQAIYFRGGAIGTVTKDSNEQCIDIGDAACFLGDRSFCDGNIQKQCSNGKLTENPCSNSGICIQKSNTETVCLEPKKCDLCNRPFGLFSQLPSQSSVSALFGGRGFEGNLFDFTLNTQVFNCASDSVACYLDKSRTVVERYYTCEGVTSCYDYASEDSCVGNTLKGISPHKCTPSQDCEWKPSKYSELGVGVCRPLEPLQQNCRAFSTSLPQLNKIANTVFGEAVAKETCQLYGDSCYYSTAHNPPTCLNKNETSCYDYNDQNDCIGPNANNNDAAPQNTIVDVTWQPIPKIYKKTSGTNTITAPSKDYFNTGICKFANGQCIRDADNNQDPTRYPLTGGKTFADSPDGRDCALQGDDPTCALDTNSPQSALDIKNGVALKVASLGYNAVDDKSTIITTWYTWNNDTRLNTYPRNKAIGSISGTVNGVLDGPWSVYFFSEDAAHNLESIKKTDVVIDTRKPQIDFSYVTINDLQNNKLDFVPKLTLPAIRADGTANDQVAYCTEAKSYRVDGPTPTSLSDFLDQSTISQDPKTEWSETYKGLGPTGTTGGIRVRYTWKCFDQAGNEEDGSFEKFLDIDNTISNPLPDQALRLPASGKINISINTRYEGTCRYRDTNDFTNTNYPTSSKFTVTKVSDTEYFHNATVTIPQGTSHKIYYVACNLVGIHGAGNENFVRGGDPDQVRVTLDNLPPKTIAFDEDGNKLVLTSPFWVRGPSIRLRCNDTEQNYPNFPRESGCGVVYHCLGSACTPSSIDDVPDAETVTPNLMQSTTLKYQSIDNLGNLESLSQVDVKVDSKAPEINLEGKLLLPIETSAGEITIDGNITNNGIDATGNECVRGPGCDVSPFKEKATRWELKVNNVVIRNGTLLVDLGADKLPILQPDGKDLVVALEPNVENNIFVMTADQAGNPERSPAITVIQDSIGPNLTNVNLHRIVRDDKGNEFAYTDLIVPFGTDFTLRIGNLVDTYPQGDTAARVSSVWGEDMFGARYDFAKDASGDWEGTIKTKQWLPSRNFPTFITLFSNDTLGNIAERQINELDGFQIVDNKPPKATVKLENKYGKETQQLIKGQNYVVVDADESLENISLYFKTGNKKYNVTFAARDFDAIKWVGYVNVPAGITGTMSVGGLMYDSNGLSSTNFITPLTGFTANSVDFGTPVPHGYTSFVNGSYYMKRTSDVTYDNLHSAADGYAQQYSVNKEFVPYPLQLDFGLNNISIREEDSLGNYYQYSQNVFVDVTSPTITHYPAGTYKSSSEIKVDFDDLGGSGIDNKTTYLAINDGTGLIMIHPASGSKTMTIKSALQAKDYSGTIYILDYSGNSVTQAISFTINPSAPTNEIKPAIIPDTDAPIVSIAPKTPTNGKPLKAQIQITGETAPLAAITLTVDGSQKATPKYISNSLYSFSDTADLTGTGPHTIAVTATDSAGNKGTASTTLNADDIDTTISPIAISSYLGLQNITGKLTSKSSEITIKIPGTVDASSIYLIGEDGKQYIATKQATTYDITVKLVGRTFTEMINHLLLVFEDAAGNREEKKIAITKDLLPPNLISLLFKRV